MEGKRGITLIELLVVTAILASLIVLGFASFSLQRQKGHDARRKADFAKLKIALEDYYNDHRCYPSLATMQNCGQDDLRPYMDKVPCDPASKRPYGYVADAACTYFGVFTTLQNASDPIIEQIGCDPACASGKPYNYGVTNSGRDLATLAAQAQ